MAKPANSGRWPELPYAAWKDTCATLHLWTQIVGKVRLAQTPWLNHSWHVALYVTARGLTTGSVPHGAREFEIEFDFIDHVLWVRTSDGESRRLVLRPMAVAEFYAELFVELGALGVDVRIDGTPNEIADAIPFREDNVHASYDRDYASRFSGRPAPLHPGGVPNLPDAVAQEAYSHEVSSAGFWPGGTGPVDYPAYYSYAYPAPEGFASAPVRPREAFFSKDLGEFILPYDAARTAADPRATLMDFLQSTYAAAADLGHWDRGALECDLGAPRQPRHLTG
jgi:hypothetical protein